MELRHSRSTLETRSFASGSLQSRDFTALNRKSPGLTAAPARNPLNRFGETFVRRTREDADEIKGG
jgi:hypothetical protein